MPNWVYNSVNISGDADKVRAMETKLAAPYKEVDNGPINFLNLIAPPDEHWDAYNSGPIAFGSEMEKNPYNWYDWNCNNWGCKWNAGGFDSYAVMQTMHDGGLDYGLKFSTAWSPPEGIMRVLSELCLAEGLRLDWHWEEEQGFGEEWETVDDEFTLVDSWDIPESHADYKHRDKEDSCPCQWADFDFHFDDCPPIEVAESVST